MSREAQEVAWPHLGKEIFVANWKMNGSLAFVEAYGARLLEQHSTISKKACVVVCSPTPYLKTLRDAVQGAVFLGSQNTATAQSGAFTGEMSANMAADIGCRYGLVGHSERRRLYHENDTIVVEKALRLVEAGVVPILCIGETEEQREMNETAEVLHQQLRHISSLGPTSGLIVAYEPVWAIGTGKTPTPDNVQKTHRIIYEILEEHGLCNVPLLYGGSVTATNAGDFLALKEVQGVLVGGASLKTDEFLQIIQCLDKISQASVHCSLDQ
ncbi:MAG: triose-phosphate isomerase [Holosporales bacterium]|jgi:triosephosphate isomerase|nr:triose-phosphate isomerase [Holosporales bacterium]